MTLAWSLAALAVSAAALLLLGIADPKRRRVRGLAPARAPRRLLALLAFAPGIVLLACGLFAALLIWIGGTALLGWSIAAALARGAALRRRQ